MNYPVKVISLASSLDRRMNFSNVNAHVDFEFFDAIEGAQIMPELGNSPDLFATGLMYNAGAVGCAMSHLMLWQEAASTNKPITIVEDDAILRHDFHEQVDKAIASLPNDWDIVVWAWNFDSILSLNVMPDVSQAVMLFDQSRMRESIAAFQAMKSETSLSRLDKCFGTPCYTISAAGARKFMENCFPLENFELYFPVLNRLLPNNGIDISMNRIYSTTNSFCALPPLALTPNEHTTSLVQVSNSASNGVQSQPFNAQPVSEVPLNYPLKQSSQADVNTDVMPVSSQRIPKVIHRIWFGSKPIPDDYQSYWEAWQRQLPDFEFVTWRDEDVLDFETSSQIAAVEQMAQKADIARYEILLKHGGIYLDCDIYPYHALEDELLDNELVVCNESNDDNICSIGFIAAKPGAKALAWAVNTLMQRELNRRPPNEETGPWFFREALHHGPYKMLPFKSFYPYLFNEPFSALLNRDLSSTYGIHVWGGSWLNNQQKLIKVIDRIRLGDVDEAISMSSEIPDDGININEYAKAARRARQLVMDAAKNSMLEGHLKVENQMPLELIKAGFYLMNQSSDLLVWQIGAADGILVDPIRALMVNFDPTSVLVEPNPYMYARLVKNYRNNRRAKFVQAALCAEPGEMTLNAINPEKAKVNGLPEWALGISSAYMDRNAIGGLTINEEIASLIGKCIESIDVTAVDVDYLLSLNEGRSPEIVVIDVEGMDAQIVQLILNKNIRPTIIQFEVQCLPQSELDSAMTLLKEEYVILGFGNDGVAYKKDFIKTYCEQIYVGSGVHTIYRDAIKFVTNMI